MHVAAEEDRRKDAMYRMLTSETSILRDKLCSGIAKLVHSRSTHPAIMEMIEATELRVPTSDFYDRVRPTLQRALIIAAIAAEPGFMQYVMDLPDICTSTMSEYITRTVPPLVQELLNGNLALDEFVNKATHEYIKL